VGIPLPPARSIRWARGERRPRGAAGPCDRPAAARATASPRISRWRRGARLWRGRTVQRRPKAL